MSLTLAPAFEPPGLVAAQDYSWDRTKGAAAQRSEPPLMSDEGRLIEMAFRDISVAFDSLNIDVEILDARVTGELRAPQTLFVVATSEIAENWFEMAAQVFPESVPMTAAERAEFRALNRAHARQVGPLSQKRRNF
jgi:hypothetical protein